MKTIVYEYAKCSTCRKALKFLDAKGVAYEKRPIVERPPARAELEKFLAGGGALKKLFNTSGELYREMKISEKLKTMGKSEALDLLTRHGKLVKRPFLIAGDAVLTGFDEAAWKKLF